MLQRAVGKARGLADDTPPGSQPNLTEAEATRLADALLLRGIVSDPDMDAALTAMRGTSLSLGQVLMARAVLTEAELLSALTEIYGCGIADLSSAPPEREAAALLPPRAALAAEAVIWRRTGSALVVATSRPDCVPDLTAILPAGVRIVTVLASQAQIRAAQRLVYGDDMARAAEGRAPVRDSCRSWRADAMGRLVLAFLLFGIALALVAPVILSVIVFGLAIAVFAANGALKCAAFAQSLRHGDAPQSDAADSRYLHLPTVSILVPLFREPEVAGALVERLRKIDYPPERLDIILAVEESDPLTQEALRVGHLPPWMRAIPVPPGGPQTKPRALNYALNFARGEIVGIYDAEDRPEPDQITCVVERFAEVPPDVACLQGRLDYYNARHNWLSRMFTIEYAAWFRVLLPGVQRMGLVVPLGGTTVFLRRPVLEEVGAWDAHNVTEDAELGLRLARAGYKTQIVDTTTYEEANAALLPWIRQRSRWLKGYLITWGSAMRQPRRLLRDLGWWRFLGLQVQVFGAVLGFLTAPLLWSFLVKAFGLWHPLDAALPPGGYGFLAALMLGGLIVSIAISVHACRAAHLRHLRRIAPLVEPYYIFGSVAAWIALVELIARPFFWAKTAHGKFGASSEETARPRPMPRLRVVGAPSQPR